MKELSRYHAFSGEYAFLSNMQDLRPHGLVRLHGIEFWTSEHAYQSQKTQDKSEKIRISKLPSPGKAKRAGKEIKVVTNWGKVEAMREVLLQKFQIPHFRDLLMATGELELVEYNHWYDTYWGVNLEGVGENHLGKLLMEVRNSLRMQLW